MTKILDTMSRLITARPYITLIALFILTVLLGYGATLRAPPTEGADVAFLPPGHPIATVTQEIDELFGESGEVRVVTLVFRGEALTPDGLAQMDGLVNSITGDPAVSGLLAPTNPVAAPSLLVKALLQVDSFESVTPEQIEAAPGPSGNQGGAGGDDRYGRGRHSRWQSPSSACATRATNRLRTPSAGSTNWRRGRRRATEREQPVPGGH